MRKTGVAVATSLVIGGALWFGVPPAQSQEFVFRGHSYCWYEKGWHRQGWYRCGYAWRKGRGWGGPDGFQGWKH
jgi:hypothetical protein